MNMEVRGRKKGGSGGRVVQDNLLTDSTAYILGLIGEGEIEGLSNEAIPESCIFLDGVPIKNEDGTTNIEGVEWWLRTGTPDQDPIPGFSSVENEVDVASKVEFSSPIERTITSDEIDAVRVKVSTPALVQVTDEGDRLESEIEYRVLIKPGAAAWETVKEDAIRGKTTSGYQRAWRIELPDVRPLIVRVERVTPDSEDEKLQNDLYFASITEIVDAKISYPDCAVLGLAIPAKAVGGSIQRVSVKIKGMKCLVPSNYDPIARTYDETTLWDGTFKSAWTRNPTWALFTTFINDRWGLGDKISVSMYDKWAAYQQAKYCDELVPDGQGGFEHRFSIDGPMSTRDDAYAWVTKLSAASRSVTYWGAGAVVPIQDAPTSPVRIVTNSEVADSEFKYAGTPISARHTTAVVSLQDVDDHYKLKQLVSFDDPDAIERYGENLSELAAPFKQSLGEGLRLAKYIVDTDVTQAETVSFEAGFGFQGTRPGDVLLVSDKYRIGHRRAGRVRAVTDYGTTFQIELDGPVSLPSGETHTVWLTDDLGETHQYPIANTGDDLTLLNVSSALDESIGPNSRFAVQSSNLEPRQYKVLRNRPDEQKKTFFITAIEYDPTKYARIEQGIAVRRDPGHLLPPTGAPDTPSGLAVTGFLRPDPGSISKLVLEASWEPHSNPLVQRYGILTKEPGSDWKSHPNVDEPSFEWQSSSGLEGDYRILVCAINALGVRSVYAEASFDSSLIQHATPAPSGWVGVAGSRSIALVGPKSPSPDFEGFRVYGADSETEDLTLLAERVASSYQRVVPDDDPFTRYKVSESRFGRPESPLSAFIEIVPEKTKLHHLDPEILDAAKKDSGDALDRFIRNSHTPAIRAQEGYSRESSKAALKSLKAELALRQGLKENSEEIASEAVMRAQEILNEAAAREQGDNALSASLASLSTTVADNAAAIVQEALARSNEDGTLAADIAAILVTTAQNAAAIVTEQTARADGDTANADAITALGVTVGQNTSDISAEQTARADADTALANNIASVLAITGSNTAAIGTEQTARTTQDAALAADIAALTVTVGTNTSDIVTEQTTRASEDAALAASIASLLTTVNGNTAAISTESSARVAADLVQTNNLASYISSNDTAVASANTSIDTLVAENLAQAALITALSTTQGNHTNSITTLLQITSGQENVLQVTSEINGALAGYALRSAVLAGGEVYSDFTFVADAFRILSGTSGVPPFVYYATATDVDGVTIPAGTLLLEKAMIGEAWIGQTQIANGVISTSKLAAAAITAEKIASSAITADKLAANSITTDKIQAGAVGVLQAAGLWQSPNFVAGVSGLSINWATADVELNDLVVRGDMLEPNAISTRAIATPSAGSIPGTSSTATISGHSASDFVNIGVSFTHRYAETTIQVKVGSESWQDLKTFELNANSATRYYSFMHSGTADTVQVRLSHVGSHSSKSASNFRVISQIVQE